MPQPDDTIKEETVHKHLFLDGVYADSPTRAKLTMPFPGQAGSRLQRLDNERGGVLNSRVRKAWGLLHIVVSPYFRRHPFRTGGLPVGREGHARL